MIKTIYHPKKKQICTKITSNTQKNLLSMGLTPISALS